MLCTSQIAASEILEGGKCNQGRMREQKCLIK